MLCPAFKPLRNISNFKYNKYSARLESKNLQQRTDSNNYRNNYLG